MPAALVAGCLLLLQSTLGALALPLGADASRLDTFGNVICTHDGAVKQPDGDPPPSHLPACCVLGCSMSFSSTLPPPADTGLVLAGRSFETVSFIFPDAINLDFARERSPSNPRAPPPAA
jgi:hypothetical protein